MNTTENDVSQTRRAFRFLLRGCSRPGFGSRGRVCLHTLEAQWRRTSYLFTMRLSALVEKIPGPHWVKVLVGSTIAIGAPTVHFYSSRRARPGHGAFDVDKPEAVQQGMEKADRARAARFTGGKQ